MPRSVQLPQATAALALVLAAPLAASPARAEVLDYADANSIVVTAAHREAPPTASAAKTGTALIDVPQSVAVISRAQLDEQAIASLNDALRYVPGVILGQGEGHRDQVSLRGQASTADFFLDGLRDDAQYYRPLYATEQVEVLKGANALLFGRGGGGGVINRVSKRARLDDASLALSGGIDSFGGWSLAADGNAPLGASAALRINATYEALANHRDGFGGHFLGIAPTATVRLGEATKLVLAYDYAEDKRTTDRGVPSLGGLPIAGYDRTFFGDPAVNRGTVQAHVARARIEHELAPGLTLDVTGLYGHYDKFYANILPASATATTVTLTGYDSANLRDNWIGQGNLVWKSGAGALRHTLLIGVEAARQDSEATRRDALFAKPGGGTASSTTAALAQSIVLPAISWTAINRSTASQVTALSAYVQEQVEIGDHIQLVGGLRRDSFRISSLNRINAFAAERVDGTWSPRAGLIIKPRRNLSLYASYAKSFLPQSGDQFAVLDATTQTLAPESFRNLEAGVKWDIRPDLSFTAALFRLDRANSRSTDPLTGNPVLTGKSRTHGFEAALTGRIIDGWRMSLGYARQDGEIRSATTAAPAGRRLAQLPRHQFTAWSHVDASARLSFGLGLVHQSSQFATISNAVRLPGFTRLDAEARYALSDRLSVQLNIENLTDARYYASAHTDANIAPGEPLNARLTVRTVF